MSETPKPPEGYATWLDYVLDPGDPYKSFAGEWAAAELAALRAERDRLADGLKRSADDLLYINGIVERGNGTRLADSVRDNIREYVKKLEAERDRLREAIHTFIGVASKCPRHQVGIGGQTVDACLHRTVVSRLPWCSVLELEGALDLPDDNPEDKP